MAVSSELRPWLHPGLPRLRGGLCGSHCVYTQPKGVGEQSETQRSPWGALCKGPRQQTQEMMSLPATVHNKTRNLGIQASTAERSLQPDCSLPTCTAVCPCPEVEASAELKGRVCGNADDAGSGAPREASGPSPEGTER